MKHADVNTNKIWQTRCNLILHTEQNFINKIFSSYEVSQSHHMLWSFIILQCFHLFVHDIRQLPRQIPVVGLHLIMILLLVFFNQPLINAKRLTAGIHKLPEKRGMKKLKAKQQAQNSNMQYRKTSIQPL